MLDVVDVIGDAADASKAGGFAWLFFKAGVRDVNRSIADAAAPMPNIIAAIP